jgi:hypothetical protein
VLALSGPLVAQWCLLHRRIQTMMSKATFSHDMRDLAITASLR